MLLARLFCFLLLGSFIPNSYSNDSPPASAQMTLNIGMLNMGEPLAYQHEGQAKGIYVDLIRTVAGAGNFEIDIQLLPYQRIFTPETWQKQDLGLVFQAPTTVDAEPLNRLSCFNKPLLNTQLKVYGLRKADKDHPRLATLIPAALNKRTDLLETVGGKSLNIIERVSVEALFKSLLSERVDYIATTDIANHYWSHILQAPPIIPFAVLAKVEGLLCHPQQRTARTTVKQFKYYVENISDDEFASLIYPLLEAYKLPKHYITYFSPNASVANQ
jgi:ABC-type amino acid transport substrate-binding protein